VKKTNIFEIITCVSAHQWTCKKHAGWTGCNYGENIHYQKICLHLFSYAGWWPKYGMYWGGKNEVYLITESLFFIACCM